MCMTIHAFARIVGVARKARQGAAETVPPGRADVRVAHRRAVKMAGFSSFSSLFPSCGFTRFHGIQSLFGPHNILAIPMEPTSFMTLILRRLSLVALWIDRSAHNRITD